MEGMRAWTERNPDTQSLEYFNRQIWSLLVNKCADKAAELIKPLGDHTTLTGFLAWQKLSREAEGEEDRVNEKLHEAVQYPPT